MSTLHLEVQGMSCGGCVKSVTAALTHLAGISTVDVDLQAGRATVTGDFPQGGVQGRGEDHVEDGPLHHSGLSRRADI